MKTTYVLFFILILSCTYASGEENQFHHDLIINANRLEQKYNADRQLVRIEWVDSYLTTLINKLTSNEPAADKFFRIKVLRNTLPYIYCLDNGAIYVSSGLIARLQNQSQLAGLLASEMAEVYRQDALSKLAHFEQRNRPKRVIPEVLAVVFTGGIAALPILAEQEKTTAALNNKLQTESDLLAMTWLHDSGFEAIQASLAADRLLETLTAEKRFGTGTLSDSRVLAIRSKQLAAAAHDFLKSQPVLENEAEFKKLIRLFGMELAAADRDWATAELFDTVMLRLENETGKDGETQFLRAEFLREHAVNDVDLLAAVDAYEQASELANAPAEVWRELGLLYRRAENPTQAKKNFVTYLHKKPNADDAPIIKMYMETL